MTLKATLTAIIFFSEYLNVGLFFHPRYWTPWLRFARFPATAFRPAGTYRFTFGPVNAVYIRH
jgi:hypothetical protein